MVTPLICSRGPRHAAVRGNAPQENHFTVPSVWYKLDVLLLAQSTKGIEEDLPGTIRENFGELRKHQSLSHRLKGTNLMLKVCLRGTDIMALHTKLLHKDDRGIHR